MAEARTRDAISADYQAARDAGEAAAMRRFQNEEACLVLLAILERLAAAPTSFIHFVALKGGILMAGELRSPRSSADIDATTGHQRRIDPEPVIADLRRAGRGFNLRLDGEPDRTPGGMIVHFRFDSLTDAGTARLEISVREDLVFAVRDAFLDVSELGIAPFLVPAVAEVELVAEKLRTLVQRSQPRDLFDLRIYLVEWAGISTLPICDGRSTPSSPSPATDAGGPGCGDRTSMASSSNGRRPWRRGSIRRNCRCSPRRSRTSAGGCESFASIDRVLQPATISRGGGGPNTSSW